MVDPLTLIVAATATSAILFVGGLYQASHAASELGRLERQPIAQTPDETFDDSFGGLPEDMAALLRRLN
jgi:hypothetical protein